MSRLMNLTWGQAFFLGLILCGVYYVTLYDSGETISKATDAKKIELTKQKNLLETVRAAKKESEKTEKELALISDQFKKVVQYFPSELNQAELMHGLMEQARLVGSRNTRISPSTIAEKGEFYEPIAISLDFESTYTQLCSFLASVTKMNRIVNVNRIDLDYKSDTEAGARIAAKTILVGYRYVESDKNKEKK